MTVKYYRRRDKFEAIRFDENDVEGAREFTRGRVYYHAKNRCFMLLTAGAEIVLRNGDYIGKDGANFDLWNEDVFEALYEEVK